MRNAQGQKREFDLPAGAFGRAVAVNALALVGGARPKLGLVALRTEVDVNWWNGKCEWVALAEGRCIPVQAVRGQSAANGLQVPDKNGRVYYGGPAPGVNHQD